MKYLIFGKGWIGSILGERLNEEVVFAKSNLLDYQGMVKEIRENSPDVVVSTAGRTGNPTVDWCETHKFETVSANTVGNFNLGQACFQENAYFVYVGTGCMYQGDNNGKGFSETDEPNFSGNQFYSYTKIWCQKLLERFPNTLQLRMRMPYDWKPLYPKNLIDKLASYKKLIVEENSITSVDDLIAALKFLVARKETGIYNVLNKGSINWRQFMDYYHELVDPNHQCEFISLEELYSFTISERTNCVLSVDKLESKGFKMRTVEEAMKDTLKKYAIEKAKLN
ncbi:RmlD substrate binding domain protein [uncultured archaeon]|nr:RmlD substrate binding domain protein [uncultured archaeon]